MTLDEFSTYVRQNTRRLRAFARHLLGGDEHAAEDVVQNTWLNLWPHHATIDAERPDGYVFQALRNEIISGRRRKKVPVTEEPPEGFLDQASLDSDGDSATLAECETHVRQALAALDAQERQALSLSLTVARDVAVALMPGYDAALFRAREKLRARKITLKIAIERLGLARLLELFEQPPQSHGTSPNHS